MGRVAFYNTVEGYGTACCGPSLHRQRSLGRKHESGVAWGGGHVVSHGARGLTGDAGVTRLLDLGLRCSPASWTIGAALSVVFTLL
eukprot:2313479-Prymnesium_polylepis.2